MNIAAQYFRSLTEIVGRSWNRFWYTPADPLPTSVLRIAVGLMAVNFFLSHTADLVRWFGPKGLLSVETVNALTNPAGMPSDVPSAVRLSYLDKLASDATLLQAAHWLAVAVAVLFTLGLFSRVTNVLTLIAVLSYSHRAPMITGPFEPVLTMLLVYLCIAPTGSYFSLDHWRLSRGEKKPPEPAPSVSANVALRLMQIHVASFYGMIVFSQLGGIQEAMYAAPWWNGEAVWWLIARSESRIVDLTFLGSSQQSFYLVNLWTHALVLCEVLFALLIWNRHLRPLFLGLSLFVWVSVALLTGLISYSLTMFLAGFAFVSPDGFRLLGQTLRSRATEREAKVVSIPATAKK